MTDLISSSLGYAQQLSNHKRMATGSPISDPNAIRHAHDKSFDNLVTAIWRWYGESMRQDRHFLENLANQSQRAKLGGFWRNLMDQRHDKQHEDYDRAGEARTWREQAIVSDSSGTESDVLLRDAMVVELQAALQILCDVVLHHRAKDPRFAQSWNERAAVTPEAEVRIIYSNLGLQLPRNFKYVVRQYEADPRLLRASASERSQIAQTVVIGIGLSPLSICYDELLDEFGLVGDSSARSLLVLAHGVEASGHSTDSTVSTLKSIWPIVRAGS